jgi:hypothetical protein
LLLVGSVHGDDLAALALKEKARRAKIAKPTKVLTEEDGKAMTGAGGGSLTTLSGDSAAPADPAPAVASIDAQKSVWTDRAVAVKAAVAAAQLQLEQMEKDVATFRSDQAPLSAAEAQDPMRLQKREAKIAEMNKAIETQKAVVAEARKSVSAFEAEARRAGVPPGWIR